MSSEDLQCCACPAGAVLAVTVKPLGQRGRDTASPVLRRLYCARCWRLLQLELGRAQVAVDRQVEAMEG